MALSRAYAAARHAAIVANPATIAATALMITAASWIQSAAFTA
jgi:hypothetical protein